MARWVACSYEWLPGWWVVCVQAFGAKGIPFKFWKRARWEGAANMHITLLWNKREGTEMNERAQQNIHSGGGWLWSWGSGFCYNYIHILRTFTKKYIDIYVVHIRLSYGWLDEMLCSGLCAERGLADVAWEGWGSKNFQIKLDFKGFNFRVERRAFPKKHKRKPEWGRGS